MINPFIVFFIVSLSGFPRCYMLTSDSATTADTLKRLTPLPLLQRFLPFPVSSSLSYHDPFWLSYRHRFGVDDASDPDMRTPRTSRCRACSRQSDKISHIDTGDDRIDTDISHIISPYPISIWEMTVSILTSPISLAHIPYRYPG